MLFNSISFICVFLPVALIVFFILGLAAQRLAMIWLCLCSLLFYSWLGMQFLALLIVSILFNYAVGSALERNAERERAASRILVFGVAVNLLVLVYYKYLFDLTGWMTGHGLFPSVRVGSPILPLGISFFTFTQIGYLVDRRAGTTKARNFIEYVVFVTFFPHLIAGPILHHREIMPQFLKPETYRFSNANFAVGLSIFTVGLLKKVLIADWFANYVPFAFEHAHQLSRMEAWRGEFSYFFQLYFDFSGYSEMAIGLARMFNITFPANFDSPYKAPNVIEFWQRWHMSLTRYVNLYVYNPIALAITRARYAKGKLANAAALRTPEGFAAMVVLPTMITMVLIGVWHGSGMQFLVFGVLHGVYLCIAHAWRLTWGKKATKTRSKWFDRGRYAGSVVLTCVAVQFAQVYFRAGSVADANGIIGAMTFWPAHVPLTATAAVAGKHAHSLHGIRLDELLNWAAIFAAFAFVWVMPNTLQIFAAQQPALVKSRAQAPLFALNWRPNPLVGAMMGMAFLCAFMLITGATAFLYFRF